MKNNFIKKITLFLIIFALIFSVFNIFQSPKKAQAIWGIEDIVFDPAAFAKMLVDWAEQIAQWAKEEAALALRDAIAKRILDYMTDQTIAWIQGGGSPQFVTDFKGFVEDAAGAAVGDVILQTNAAFLCSPFKAQIMLQLQPTPKFSERIKCTLDDIVGNVNDFYSDFSKGGWIGYVELMKPQNNYYGVALQVSANLNEQMAKAVDAASKDVQAGSGFLSVKRCKGGGIKNPSPRDIDELGLIKDFQGNYCQEKNLENTTPGNVVGVAVASAITSDSQWAANIQSIVAALINALINRLTKEGLSLMSDSNSSDINSAAGYTAKYNNVISQNVAGNKNAMVNGIEMFMSEWKDLLKQYKIALGFNTQIVSALKEIESKNCQILGKPGEDTILDAYKVGSVGEALEKANADQIRLTKKVDDLDEMILAASSTIDQINILYKQAVSTSTLPVAPTSTKPTASTSTSTIGNPLIMGQIQGLYSGFMNKYNTQSSLMGIFEQKIKVKEEIVDKENKANLARKALFFCGGGNH